MRLFANIRITAGAGSPFTWAEDPPALNGFDRSKDNAGDRDNAVRRRRAIVASFPAQARTRPRLSGMSAMASVIFEHPFQASNNLRWPAAPVEFLVLRAQYPS
jgi:hypothetical protein